MIEYIKGQIVQRKPTGLVVACQGVGYGLDLPLSTLCQISATDIEIELWVYTHVREDALRLFGFISSNERQLFELLLSVSGIGPKLALAILSTLSAAVIHKAVAMEQLQVFESVPGVGRRMAEKLLLELKAKAKKLAEIQSGRLTGATANGPVLDRKLENPDIVQDVYSALENLGFKNTEIGRVLGKISRDDSLDFNSLLRQALLELGGQVGAAKDVGMELK